jgi:hypothetical protein
MERIETLRIIEFLGWDIAFAERGHSQVHESAGKVRATQAAFRQQKHLPLELSISRTRAIFSGDKPVVFK